MTERRFRVEGALEAQATVPLSASTARHVEVLRLEPGAAIVLFDGRGVEADAVLARVDGALVARVVRRREVVEPWHVSLILGMPKASVLDGLVRGVTEVGVSELVLFEAARSSARLAEERLDHKLARYLRIVEEAARQSERARAPSLVFARTLEEALDRSPPTAGIVALDAREGTDLGAALGASAAPRTLVIGPEGGLDPGELALAVRRGATLARASLPVLRVETAAVVLSALAVLAARSAPPIER